MHQKNVPEAYQLSFRDTDVPIYLTRPDCDCGAIANGSRLWECRERGRDMKRLAPGVSPLPSPDDSPVQILLVMQPLLLTVGQVAHVLNFSRSKVYELINGADLPVLRFGKSVRVRVSALEQWLNRQEEKAGECQLERVS